MNMRGSGQDKVLLGTNYPMVPLKRCLDEIDGLGLDDAARRKFIHDNAVRVFKLKA
jgi:hypothetical protein